MIGEERFQELTFPLTEGRMDKHRGTFQVQRRFSEYVRRSVRRVYERIGELRPNSEDHTPSFYTDSAGNEAVAIGAGQERGENCLGAPPQ